LACPGGTEITLANTGQLSGTTITNMCFSTGGAAIGSGSSPYTGSFAPFQAINGLNGCTSNGVWTMKIIGQNSQTCIPLGGIGGWTITFDDPPVFQPVTASWSPTTGLSSTNTVNTTACPTNTTNYVLTLSNGTPGCPTHTENVNIIVDPCGGCIPPAVNVNTLNTCSPGTVNLSSAIAAGSAPATFTYHATQVDAQNDVNTISTIVSTSGTYWVRYEDPTDSTCFGTAQIVVTINPADNAAFTVTNFCAGSANQATAIATPGGTFSFNPVPTDGATINPSTGTVSNAVSGTIYTIQYTTNGTCPSSITHTMQMNPLPTPVITGGLSYCTGGQTTLSAGGPYSSYSWSTGPITQTINTTAQNGITVTVVDNNGCQGTSPSVNVTEVSQIVINSTIDICQGQTATIHGIQQTTAGVYSQNFPSTGGCDSISNVTLVIHPNPTPVITGNLWYCEGDQVNLNAGGPYASYSWSTGGNQQTIQTTTTNPITVTVTDINGCSGTSAAVSLIAPPVAIVGANPSTGTAPLVVTLTNGSQNANVYQWDFGNGLDLTTGNTNSHTQTYDSIGQYTVVLIASQNGCSDTAYVTIVVLEPAQPMIIEFPNIFTPNGDHNNDFFEFKSSNVASLEVTVTNRWGNLMFHSTDVHFKWDGTGPGGDASEGVYFYQYKVTGILGEQLEGQKFVHLVK
jgi:gliding motility-associated-like protein